MFRTCLQFLPVTLWRLVLPTFHIWLCNQIQMASVNSNCSKAFLDFTGALDIQFAAVTEADFNVRVNIRTRQELYLITREYTS